MSAMTFIELTFSITSSATKTFGQSYFNQANTVDPLSIMSRLTVNCLIFVCSQLLGFMTLAMDTPFHKTDICFNDNAKAELHQLCTEITRQFPAEDYFYIGIGRSPTPIILWLQSHSGYDAAVQIPLTNFKLCTIVDDNLSEPEFPSGKSEAILFRHFDKYLRQYLGAPKKWLVIDTAMTGNTLKSAGFALTQYLQTHQQDTTVEMLAISENCNDASTYTSMGMHVAMVAVNDDQIPAVTSLESSLLHGGCKIMAPFGELDWQHLLNGISSPLPHNPSAHEYLSQQINTWSGLIAPIMTWVLTLGKKGD